MRKATHSEGQVGGPCNTIKRDGYWCTQLATTVIDGRGYCPRHKHNTGEYGPVSAEKCVGPK